MNSLARREHSQYELHLKLIKRFPDNKSDISPVLDVLSEEGLQSDERFSEAYVRFRGSKGYGPDRIEQELRQRGLSDFLISRAIDGCEYDWAHTLEEQCLKKFGNTQPDDLVMKAKYMRFLVYRGFSHEQVQQLLHGC